MTTPPPSDSFAAAPEQAPAPAQKKKGGVLKKVGSVVVLIVVAVAVKLGLPYVTGEAPVHAKAGECVTVSGPENDPKVDSQPCDSGKPDLYKVVKVVDNTFDVEKCGQDGEVALAQQLDSDKFVLCLNAVKK